MAADPLATLRLAAAALADHPDLEVRNFGRWIATFPAELSGWFGIQNSAGRSERQAMLLEQRNALIRASRLSARRLTTEFSRYFSDNWPRDKLHDGCPYPPEDPRSAYWQALRLVPRPLSLRMIQRIRENRAISPVLISPPAAVVRANVERASACNSGHRAGKTGLPRKDS